MSYPPYIDIFGAGPVWPSSISYVSYDLPIIGKSIVLEFPQVATTEYVTAGTINIVTDTSTYTITMPDVTIVSVGYTIWLRNSGSANVTIYKNDGTVLLVAEPGITYFLQVIDNSYAAGEWYVGEIGAGTSSVITAQLAGPGLISYPVDPTKLATNIPSKNINTSGYTILDTDRASLLIWTGGTDSINLLDLTDNDGFLFYLYNASNGGILTLTASSGQTINGLSSITINPSDSFEIVATTNGWYTIGVSNLNFNNFSFLDGSISGPSINFQSDPTAGFSFSFGSFSSEAINVSLHGSLQASFQTTAGIPTNWFRGSVLSSDGTYIFGSTPSSSRMEVDNSGILSTTLIGSSSTFVLTVSPDGTMTSDSTAQLSIIARNVEVDNTTLQGDVERNNVSYLAWTRLL